MLSCLFALFLAVASVDGGVAPHETRVRVAVPDLVGDTVADAKPKCTSKGLVLMIDDDPDDPYNRWREPTPADDNEEITQQMPPAATEVPAGSVVGVVLYVPPPPPPQPGTDLGLYVLIGIVVVILLNLLIWKTLRDRLPQA